MTGHKLCSPGEFKDPRVFVESQDEYTKAQLSLSYEFSDQNISTMLRDYDIEGLCAATRSVTGDYLTEEEYFWPNGQRQNLLHQRSVEITSV